ncbi:MAG: glycoside hydrolase domain-containing protein [Gaiellaceae bacterium]
MRARSLHILAVVAAVLFATSAAGSASNAAAPPSPSYFTGYGFDACTAPSLEKMDAWLASPYRAVGIYLGGQNRACADGNLKPAWVNTVRAMGWNLLPLWVGRQAPCVSQKDLSLISPGSAGSQGKAAADNAAGRAAYFGLEAGSPIYYDMEGYKPTVSCTLTVQRFVRAWTKELHVKGYTSGVYGSAASTIRDLVGMLEDGSEGVPDDIWIARWDGVKKVFGEPIVSDDYWSEHQRVHQYRGGHNETYGGVKINIDSNYVDGAVVAAAATLPTDPPIGTASTSDGAATVSWWESSFDASALVTLTLTSSSATVPLEGFAAPSYVLQLQTVDELTTTPVARFNTLLAIHVTSPPKGAVVAFSADGLSWKTIRRLRSAALPVNGTSGYLINADGSLDIYTLVPGYFALLQDVAAPTAPGNLRGHLVKRKLELKWRASGDNSGAVAGYQIIRDGLPIQTVAGTAKSALVSKLRRSGRSIYRVRSIDGAGNQSPLSGYVKLVAKARPRGLPRIVPRWAWRRLAWQEQGRKGKRPYAPRPLPGWYWRWAGWKLSPYRVR